MSTINLSPALNQDLSTKSIDLLNTTIIFKDNLGNPINFSGYSHAYLQIYSQADQSVLLTYSSTGSTYKIDVSQWNIGVFIISCNSIPLSAGEYLYNLYVNTPTKQQSVMYGKLILVF